EQRFCPLLAESACPWFILPTASYRWRSFPCSTAWAPTAAPHSRWSRRSSPDWWPTETAPGHFLGTTWCSTLQGRWEPCPEVFPSPFEAGLAWVCYRRIAGYS